MYETICVYCGVSEIQPWLYFTPGAQEIAINCKNKIKK